MKDFNFMKEFMIRLLRNNVYLNIKSCKWSENKNELCSAYGVWPETRLHLFYSCPKTNEIVTFLEKILRKQVFKKMETPGSLFSYIPSTKSILFKI